MKTILLRILFVIVLIIVAVFLYKIVVPARWIITETPYFSIRFPGEAYHTPPEPDYNTDTWDISVPLKGYYFVYANHLDSPSTNWQTIAEDAKRNFFSEPGGKIFDEELKTDVHYNNQVFLSGESKGRFIKILYIPLPEKKILLEVGVSSPIKDNYQDFTFFVNSLRLK